MSRLTTFTHDPILDMDPWIGQRFISYRYTLVNALTGQPLRTLTPQFGGSLSHDTGRIVARSLSLSLGVADTAAINPLTDRIDMEMIVNRTAYPLGRYVFVSNPRQVYTSGELTNVSLVDEMFVIDQQMEIGYNASGKSSTSAIQDLVTPFGFGIDIEASPFTSVESWSAGTYRGQALSALALTGDYFQPWMGSDRRVHVIRSFDPAVRVPDFDFDAGRKVIREPITRESDILTAPNRFVVISNAGLDATQPVVGTADVPLTAPHSIPNRGFVLPSVVDLQVGDVGQAQAVAVNLSQRQAFERMDLETAPDPRHEAFNVIVYNDEAWLEIGWSLNLNPGGTMNHALRKAYA